MTNDTNAAPPHTLGSICAGVILRRRHPDVYPTIEAAGEVARWRLTPGEIAAARTDEQMAHLATVAHRRHTEAPQ